MKNKKWFDSVICFMIGRGKINLDKEFNEKQNELLKEELSEYNVPIITSCDFGHVRPFITIINGVDTILEYKENNYIIKYN
ncbi:LD-carboxypeptidase [compost metagenome]